MADEDFDEIELLEARRQLKAIDQRLPQTLDQQGIADLLTRTAARNARMIRYSLVRLKSLRLFGAKRNATAFAQDGVAIQILIELGERYARMASAPLGEGETEMQREEKLSALLVKIQDSQNRIIGHVHRVTEHQTKCAIEARKIAEAIRRHNEKMEIEREKLARGAKAAATTLTDAELLKVAEAKDAPA